MKIFLITFDTNLINTKQHIDAMNTLEYWNNLGLIHLLKTDTMEIEFQKNINGNRKALFFAKSKIFKEDYGTSLVGHSKYLKHFCSSFVNPDIFDEISAILFGTHGPILKGLNENKLRDIAHLNTHYMNDRDFFITMDNHFHDKKDILKKKYNINIFYPDECVCFIENYWKMEEKEDLPIKNPNNDKASIIIGTEVTHHLIISHKNNKLLEVLNFKNKYFIVTANIYNREGECVVDIDHERVLVKGSHSKVYCSYFNENKLGMLIPINKCFYSELYVHDNNELLLKAEVFPNGDLLLYGRIYDDKGNLLANINKETLEYENYCFKSFYEEKLENGRLNFKLINWS